MAAAPPPSPIEWTWPANKTPAGARPPLELQLLPPSPFAASQSPWGVDPSRLQQLMMGTSAASSPAIGHHTPSPDLGALSDNRGTLQPLPSGWERCLDLQSGEVFLKQCHGSTRALERPYEEQRKAEKPGSSRGADELPQRRQDWSFQWLDDDDNMLLTAQYAAIKNSPSSTVSITHGADSGMPTLIDREPLCLDLDLGLTNGKRSKPSMTIKGVPFPRASSCFTASVDGDLRQTRKWQQCAPSSREKPSDSNIQEMAKESTMLTAVCSKCLMYVLLRKSKPVCPRCSLPIVLDGSSISSVSRKRPLHDHRPRDLLLSTDS